MRFQPVILITLVAILMFTGCGSPTPTPLTGANATETPTREPTATRTPTSEPTLTPTPAPTDTPEPTFTPTETPVPTYSLSVGGHVSRWDLSALDRMHYAGMNWIVTRAYNYGDVSSLIAKAHEYGFKIQVSAVGNANSTSHSNFEQDYATWVGEIAGAGADAIEIWTEPNLPSTWAAGHIDPDTYTSLLCASYEAIKAANKHTLVISGAPAPTGYFGGCGSNGCDDLPWLEALYAAGAGDCMDYIGAHHMAGATAPSARSGHPMGRNHVTV